MNTPKNFRQALCDSCAWFDRVTTGLAGENFGFCRRGPWGGSRAYQAQLGQVSAAAKACPAFVPREKGSDE